MRANALRESCRNLLADGFLSEARAALWDWRAVGEADAANGNWPLARARLFRRLGWHAAAHRVLAAAAQANELLPNLPDVEFEDAEVLSLLGQREEAAALYRKIVTQYPNHPLARQAEARLR
ncbi:MAG: hypothetical protein BWZ02_00688 [Lentisphaerae bacterium ADurb.BinA184]|nr:MAG: hypothetical protein BWZ02_00688 [Lentisphaerae bacterium ADurb.BinA184]